MVLKTFTVGAAITPITPHVTHFILWNGKCTCYTITPVLLSPSTFCLWDLYTLKYLIEVGSQVSVLSWQAHFTQHNVLRVPPYCRTWQGSLPFSGWVTFHGLYTRAVIQASVGGRLGHSHVLATVTSAAVNMGVRISLQDAAVVSPLGCVPGSGCWVTW